MANAICLLYDMCRLCLDKPGKHDILKSNTLIQDILLCTGILQISCTDKLPRKICSSCVYKIETAKDLRRYSTKNDLYMQSLLDSKSKIVHEIARPIRIVKPLEEIVSSSTETDTPGDSPKMYENKLNDKNKNNSPSKSSERSEETSQNPKDSSSKSPVRSETTDKMTKKRKTKMKTRICKPKPLSGTERQLLSRLSKKEDQKTETSSNSVHRNNVFRLMIPIPQPSKSIQSLNIFANVVPMHIDDLEKTNIKTSICEPKPLSGAEGKKEKEYKKLDRNNERQNLTFPTQPSTSAPSLNVVANVVPKDVDDLEDAENINIAGQSKISVRSLADINSSVLPPSSSAKGETSHKKKMSNTASPDGRKTETNNKHKCDSSSGQHNTSPVQKKKRSVSTEDWNKSGANGDHECDICKKTYPTPRKLYMHRRSHAKKLYCPLDACGKNFASKGDLQKHIRSHTGEKPYKCDLCDKSFTQNVTLRSHKEAVHIEKM